MSGTSLDGLDIAYCHFTYDSIWNFEILQAETIPHAKEWKEKLTTATQLSGYELTKLDVDLGIYFGNCVNAFLKKHEIDKNEIDVISSHGHTIFHRPDLGLTLQIGSGAHILSKSNIKTICDFRTLDVARGGQGAPLVPIGDLQLFPVYDYCLNLGGIANISFDENGIRKSFDISIANIAGNYLCSKINLEYDDKGLLAQSGNLLPEVLEKMNALPYFEMDYPKSLGIEFFENEFKSILDLKKYTIKDLLHTFGVHLGMQIGKTTTSGKLLITGGGAYNDFWIAQIKKYSVCEVVIPNNEVIDFKEALIFAFLGVLKLRNEVNCLASVTGASMDSCGGILYS